MEQQQALVTVRDRAPKQHGLWTDEEIAELRRIYLTETVKEAAKKLGRTINATRRMATLHQMGMERDPFWTTEKDGLLRRLAPTTAKEDIAEQLGCALITVRRRLRTLGINCPVRPPDREKRGVGYTCAEDQFIRHCSHLSNKEIAAALGRSETAIETRIRRIGTDLRLIRWTEAEVQYLRHYFPTEGPEAVAKALGRTVSSIISKAGDLKIASVPKRGHPLMRLLEDIPEAYYWVGFLFADGSLSGPVGGRPSHLTVTLAEKDTDHLIRLATFIGSREIVRCTSNLYGKLFPQVSLTVSDCLAVGALSERYDMRRNKTQHPPELATLGLSDEALTAMLVGFFDGDGCLASANVGYISSHMSWMGAMTYLVNRVSAYLGVPPIRVFIQQSSPTVVRIYLPVGTMKKLRAFTRLSNLPVLARKWTWTDNLPPGTSPGSRAALRLGPLAPRRPRTMRGQGSFSF